MQETQKHVSLQRCTPGLVCLLLHSTAACAATSCGLSAFNSPENPRDTWGAQIWIGKPRMSSQLSGSMPSSQRPPLLWPTRENRQMSRGQPNSEGHQVLRTDCPNFSGSLPGALPSRRRWGCCCTATVLSYIWVPRSELYNWTTQIEKNPLDQEQPRHHPRFSRCKERCESAQSCMPLILYLSSLFRKENFCAIMLECSYDQITVQTAKRSGGVKQPQEYLRPEFYHYRQDRVSPSHMA